MVVMVVMVVMVFVLLTGVGVELKMTDDVMTSVMITPSTHSISGVRACADVGVEMVVVVMVADVAAAVLMGGGSCRSVRPSASLSPSTLHCLGLHLHLDAALSLSCRFSIVGASRPSRRQ